jgi:hypothetical protein
VSLELESSASLGSGRMPSIDRILPGLSIKDRAKLILLSLKGLQVAKSAVADILAKGKRQMNILPLSLSSRMHCGSIRSPLPG